MVTLESVQESFFLCMFLMRNLTRHFFPQISLLGSRPTLNSSTINTIRKIVTVFYWIMANHCAALRKKLVILLMIKNRIAENYCSSAWNWCFRAKQIKALRYFACETILMPVSVQSDYRSIGYRLLTILTFGGKQFLKI